MARLYCDRKKKRCKSKQYQGCEFEPPQATCPRYNIVIKYVSNLPQVGGYLRVLGFLANKTDHHDITEILLKVALSTIKQISTHSQLIH